eukprot:c17812_g1_i1.p1 GENE.c17812_g1_i1~~c17812_g1_i1.p1  ORF type:complete len:186 (+),score=25.44 c17812_g1_i1:641-1198(+)
MRTTRCKWAKQEDSALLQVMKQISDGPNATASWRSIAAMLGIAKTPRQCRERWRNVLDPTIKRGPWTPKEDQVLQEKVQELGPRWCLVAECLPGRTDTATKNRYISLTRRQEHIERCQARNPAQGGSPEMIDATQADWSKIYSFHFIAANPPVDPPSTEECDSVAPIRTAKLPLLPSFLQLILNM